MNTTTPVCQTPYGGDANQPSAAASDSAADGAHANDFARALSNAGAKPSRKPPTHRTTGVDSSGGQLPAAGKASPSLPAAAPAGSTPAAGLPAILSPALAGTAHTATGDQPVGEAAPPSGTPAAAQLNAGGSLIPPAAAAQPLAAQAAIVKRAGSANISAPTAAHIQDLGAPMPTDVPVNAASAAASTPLIGGAAIRAAAKPAGPAVSADSAALKEVPAPTAGPASLPRAAAPSGAADSTPGLNTQANPAPAESGSPAPTTAEPAAVAPAVDSAPPLVGLAMPERFANQPEAAQANAEQPNGAPAHPSAISMPRGLAAAAAAASAASNAQALLTRGNPGAADKRSPGSTEIPSLSLASTDANGAAGAAQLLANPTASTDATPAPVLKVAATVDSAEFGPGVAAQVSLMVDRNLNAASLQVNPPALGPIEVRIALQGGHAQVWFTSHSAVTRDALASGSSKLREMLGTQGFAQVSVDISQRSFQERSSQSQAYQAMPPVERSAAPGAAVSGASAHSRSTGSIARAASGRVDAYA